MTRRKQLILASGLSLVLVGTSVWALAQGQNKEATRAVSNATSPINSQIAGQSKKENPTRQKQDSASALRPDLLEPNKQVQPVTESGKKVGQALLDQRPQKAIQSSAFDFTSLSQGDLTSIAGTWSDANGWSLIFSPTGIVTEHAEESIVSSIAISETGDYRANVTIKPDQTGFALFFYPAGYEIPAEHFAFTQADPSDISRDRLVAGHDNRFDYDSTQAFLNRVYYKVSDDYPKHNQEIDKNQTSQQVTETETSQLETTISSESATESSQTSAEVTSHAKSQTEAENQ